MNREVVISESKALVAATRAGILVPRVIAAAGDQAGRRFLEFFAATIRNKNTRMAYYHACVRFFAWCDHHKLGEIADIEPLHVAAYVEALGKDFEKPTVKQHLAAIRMLFATDASKLTLINPPPAPPRPTTPKPVPPEEAPSSQPSEIAFDQSVGSIEAAMLQDPATRRSSPECVSPIDDPTDKTCISVLEDRVHRVAKVQGFRNGRLVEGDLIYELCTVRSIDPSPTSIF